MEHVEFRGTVTKVEPKIGRGSVIEVKVVVPYTSHLIVALAEMMRNTEESVDFKIEYDPLPLFSDDDDKQGELGEDQEEEDWQEEGGTTDENSDDPFEEGEGESGGEDPEVEDPDQGEE